MSKKLTLMLTTIIATVLLSSPIWLTSTVPAVQADSDLPGRATPVPTPESSDTGSSKEKSAMVGAYIELTGVGASSSTWAVVQWQDGIGNWHDVGGWQGDLAAGSQRWWVHPKDFGTGPFRWQVQAANSDSPWHSQPFYLPLDHHQIVQVVAE